MGRDSCSASIRSVMAAGYTPLDIVMNDSLILHAAGGTAANVAMLLAAMGWDAAIAGRVGADHAGRMVRAHLASSGVAVEFLASIPDATSARLIYEIGGDQPRYHYSCTECGQKFRPSRPLAKDQAQQIISSGVAPDVLFIDRLNWGTILLAEHLGSTGTLVIFEPSRPAAAVLRERMLDVCMIVKFAAETSGMLDSRPRPHQIWIVTEGRQGAQYRIGSGKWKRSPAFQCPVVDAGGAGDWTTAGIIDYMSHESVPSLDRIGASLRWGQALAAVNCGTIGATGALREWGIKATRRAAARLCDTAQCPDMGKAASRDQSSMSSVDDELCKVCLAGKTPW